MKLSISKHTFIIALTTIIIFTLHLSASALEVTEEDSVAMGSGYANDIYYSMNNGQVSSVDRTNWDIAFYTFTWSAAILTNGAAGVELYTYPTTDTGGWASVDTAGLSSWKLLYNSPEEWEDGAFNRHSKGHPDYGWGQYNPITHNVVGDSLYIIKLQDGTFKKLWIKEKVSIDNLYVYKYANLDGTGEREIELDCNEYIDKRFVYFSVSDGEIRDRDPNADTWDILFTKYMSIQPDGTPYPVTGVLNNFDVAANKFEEIAPDYDDWTALPMDTVRSPIGYEWKVFELSTFSWAIVDSLAYFVQALEGDVFKLVFTNFEGTGTGKIGFIKSLTSATDISEIITETIDISIAPNPVIDHMNIAFPEGITGGVNVMIMDISGKMILKTEKVLEAGASKMDLNLANYKGGLYILTVIHEDLMWSKKIIVASH